MTASNSVLGNVKDVCMRKLLWCKDNQIYIVAYIIFLFVSTLGFWVFGLNVTNQTMLIFSLPLVTSIVIDTGLTYIKNKNDEMSVGAASIFIFLVFISIVWVGLWWWGIAQCSISSFSIQGFVATILLLVGVFLFNSEKSRYEEKANTGAPSVSDTEAKKEQLG